MTCITDLRDMNIRLFNFSIPFWKSDFTDFSSQRTSIGGVCLHGLSEFGAIEEMHIPF